MTTRTICNEDSSPLDEYLGKDIIVRTVTFYFTGHLVSYSDHWLLLDDAAWIADAGKWSTVLTTGKPNEVEPYPGKCLVSAGAVVDICEWAHPLPRIVK